MKKLSIAVSVAAFMVSTQAVAADFIRYTFHTQGSGTTLTTGPDFLPLYTPIVGADFVYVIPLSGVAASLFPVTVTTGSSTFFAMTASPGVFGGQTTNAQATNTTFGFTATGSGSGGPTGTGAVSTCGSFGGTFPTASFAAASSCGSASFNVSGRGGAINYSGEVKYVDVALTSGEPSSIGFVAFIPEVPEPATWAMMLLGFGVIGYAMRRRPKVVFATN